MKDSIKPVLKAGRTKTQIQDQGLTYNESGFTYNQSGWQYGGKYDHDVVPTVNLSKSVSPTMRSISLKPSLKVGKTEKQIEDQSYSYNQSGFTYNQLGWMYGGLFNHDVIPIVSSIQFTVPKIKGLSVKPTITLGKTKKQIEDQGFTYNQIGFTYNQNNWQYGGIYEHDSIPLVSLAKKVFPTMRSSSVKPSLKVNKTNKEIENQNYTYNQTGFSYNEVGWEYGGLFNHDIYPLISQAKKEQPHLRLGMDFGATVIPPPPPGSNSGMLIGLLGLTYP